MRLTHPAVIALVSGGLAATAEPLAAQVTSGTFAQVSGGLTAKPAYGLSHSSGVSGLVTLGRFVARGLALRLDLEYHAFGYQHQFPESPPCGPDPATCPAPPLGHGAIRTTALLANLEWHERAAGGGFYFVAGAGPDYLTSHPDRSVGWRLTYQAGAGIALSAGRAGLLLEARYQVHAGGGEQPPHTVPLTLGVRYGL
jgi:hypothetical protein